jgi:hypothetical protein
MGTLHGVEHGLDRSGAGVGLIDGGGVERGSGFVDDIEQRNGDVGGEAGLVADLGGAEDVDGGEVEVVLLQVMGRLFEKPTPVVRYHHGIDPRCRDPFQ